MAKQLATQQQTKQDCDCPVCTGLQCFDRPRFFTGQLLTETELNSQQAYGIAKHKLHNRYLHGSGIVCGLEVTCHECDSHFVTVQPGYALDGCGNDIVVCAPHDFNIIKAIEACRQVERRNCDPWRTAAPRDCTGVEQEWCLTIRYREKMGRPATALVSQPNGRCACGAKNGQTCGCGQNGAATATQIRPAQTCEPARIIEDYELGVVCLPEKPAGDDENQALQMLLEMLDKLGIHLPYECVLACYTDLTAFSQELVAIFNLINGDNAFTNRQQAARRFCLLLENIRRYLLDDHLTRCNLIQDLNAINCPTPPATDAGFQTFLNQMRTALLATFELLINLLVNCICYEILPKCPPDVCEDRLLLACVTVRDGKVLRICHSPRHYVLTRHNLVAAVLSVALADICCTPFDLPNRDQIATAPNRAFATDTLAASFAGAATRARSPFMATAAAALGNINIEPFLGTRPAASAVDPAGVTGLPVNDARATLGARPVTVEHVNWSMPEAWLRNMAAAPLPEGEGVKLFVDPQNRVVGVGRLAESDRLAGELAQANERISKLEQQLAKLSAK
ncbi:MAG: hypothetical protein FOGNACKC_00020 [Anaerolineae bacterium]|nr:hypothetical protein [Anaerolineae bacterium]